MKSFAALAVLSASFAIVGCAKKTDTTPAVANAPAVPASPAAGSTPSTPATAPATTAPAASAGSTAANAGPAAAKAPAPGSAAAGTSAPAPSASGTVAVASSAQPAPTTAASPAPASGSGRAIRVIAGANNEMKFDQTALTATQGETITLTLNNASTQPKMVMGHNLVILKPGTDVTDFALESAGAVATEYIPDSMRGTVVAATKLLGPNETATITFRVPNAPGEYPFLCSFPGHFGTMQGKLTVR